MLNWLKARVDALRDTKIKGITLVSNFLAGALWLIESKFLPLAREGYAQNEVVYACLRLLSQSVPEPPMVAYQKDRDGEQTVLDAEHPLMQLIHAPNELMTEYEFWELTTLYMAIGGRAVWWKRRDNAGRLVALWPLRPDRVGPIYSDSEAPGEQILWGYSYQEPGTGKFIPIVRRDTLSFNFPDPAGESGGIVEGLGPVQALARMVASDNEATKYVGALLANYAIPGVVVKLKRELRNEDEAKAVKAHFRAEFGGANRGTPAVADAETEVTELGFNLRELEFPEIREISESRIAAALGVPAVLVGLRIGLKESNSRASVTELREFFTETTLANYWRRFQDQFSNDVAVEFGPGLVCEFDLTKVKALAQQQAQKMAPLIAGFKDGVVTENDYRAALNLPPLADGDVLHIPSNVVLVPAMLANAPLKMLTGRPRLTLLSGVKAIDPREQAERELQRALETLFADKTPELARRINQGETITDEEIAEGFARVIEPQLVKAATNEGIRLATEIQVQWDPAVINSEAISWARSHAGESVTKVTETTQKLIGELVADYAATPGMTIGELQDRLRTLPGAALSNYRAEAIAISEITDAYSAATNSYQEQLRSEGIEMERVWLTNNDEKTCPQCGPLHNQPESKWQEVSPGTPMTGPKRHVRCRCSTTLRAAQKKKAAA